MASINLLPWRARRRAERRREFAGALVLVLLAAAAVLLPARAIVEGQLGHQEARNALLRQHVMLLDDRLAELSRLQARQQALRERLDAIQALQDGRRRSVELFDALARSVPDGLHYERVVRRGDQVELEGVARSDAEVSDLLRRLEASACCTAPVLQQLRAGEAQSAATQLGEAQASAGPRRFQLSVLAGGAPPPAMTGAELSR